MPDTKKEERSWGSRSEGKAIIGAKLHKDASCRNTDKNSPADREDLFPNQKGGGDQQGVEDKSKNQKNNKLEMLMIVRCHVECCRVQGKKGRMRKYQGNFLRRRRTGNTPLHLLGGWGVTFGTDS